MRISPLFVPLEYIINLDEKILDSIPAEYYYIITSNGARVVEADIAMCVDPKKRFPAINIVNFIETVMAHYPIKKKSQDYAKIIFSSDMGGAIDSIMDEIQEYTKDQKQKREKVYTITPKHDTKYKISIPFTYGDIGNSGSLTDARAILGTTPILQELDMPDEQEAMERDE